MSKKSKNKSPLLPTLRSMSVGDVCSFAITRLNPVRTSCSNMGLELGRKYSTHINKENATIEVTRIL